MLANAIRSARAQADVKSPMQGFLRSEAGAPSTSSPSAPAGQSADGGALALEQDGMSGLIGAQVKRAAAAQESTPADSGWQCKRDKEPHSAAASQQSTVHTIASSIPDAGALNHQGFARTDFRWQNFEDLVDIACGSCGCPTGTQDISHGTAHDTHQAEHADPLASSLQDPSQGLNGMQALHVLAGWPVSIELLQQSQAGRRIRQLKKQSREEVSSAAENVICTWKHRLAFPR